MILFKTFCMFGWLLMLQVVSASDWSIENFRVNSNNGLLQVKIDSLMLPNVDDKIVGIIYRCKNTQTIYPIHNCNKGAVAFKYNGTQYDLLISGWFNLQEQTWQLEMQDVLSQVSIVSDSINKDQIIIKVDQLKVSKIIDFLKKFTPITTTSSGLLSAEIKVNFYDKLVINVAYTINEFSWESEDGEYIFAETTHAGKVELIQSLSGIQVDLQNNLTQGEGLFKDIYVLFDESPIDILSTLHLDSDLTPIKTNMKVNSTEDIEFTIELLDWYDNSIQIDYHIKDLKRFHESFLASYLEIIGINDLEVIGISKGQIFVKKEKVTKANIDVSELYMEIESKRTQLTDVNAQLKWQAEGQFQSSDIQWQELLLAGMPIKKSEVSFASVGQQIELTDNTVLPIFDGSLIINQLSMQELFKPQIAIDFDGEVTPISIALITEKMGWPLMNGSISGKIPGMKKSGHSITFDGSLDLNIFGGQMKVNNLSTERLFGIAPVIAADITFDKLNLKQITSTFDFGEVTGLINGYVNQLRITNWKADRMDAHIQSVKSKGIKQTISQRAIDNISSIGGIQGALSRSFLRFFDNFKYKKIGIGCKLRNSICEMSGIKAINSTYQIIQGKGIPSININGFRRFIDWEVFLDRLLNAGY